MARRSAVVVFLAGWLLWAIQACGGESFDDAQDRTDMTGGTTGRGGDSASGSGGVAGGGTSGAASMPGAGMGGEGGVVAGMGGEGGAVAGASGAGGGGVSTCEEVRMATSEELASIRSCTMDSECGQVLSGTSCGCTRDLVARLDADATRFYELLATRVDGQTCSDFGSSCDCPPADGFECENNQCGFRYVDPTSCEIAPIGMLCVVGPDDGMLDVGDPLTIMVGASGCYSSSCTQTVIGECSVEEAGENYVADARICVRDDSSGRDCTDDCGGAPSPRCESETTLRAGTHTVRLDNFSVTFEVPSELSGARCNGFL